MAHYFPILVVIIVVISKILAASGRQAGGSGPSQSSTPRAKPPTDTEEERMRRFMEAVGLPPDATPPPPVQPRTSEEPPPLLPVNPPALYPMPGRRLKRVPPVVAGVPSTGRVPRGQPASIFQPSPSPAPVAMAPMEAFPQSTGPAIGAVAVAGAEKQIAYPAKGLLLRLRNPNAVREAVILREVLGPPKAFQGDWRTYGSFLG